MSLASSQDNHPEQKTMLRNIERFKAWRVIEVKNSKISQNFQMSLKRAKFI